MCSQIFVSLNETVEPMSLSVLISCKLLTASTGGKTPSHEAIIKYFEKFGVVKNVIPTVANELLIEFETKEAAKAVLDSDKHIIEDCRAEVGKISLKHPPKKYVYITKRLYLYY